MSALTALLDPVLRWSDYRLSDDEQAVSDLFADFFANESPIEVVAAAASATATTTGFDDALWAKAIDIGAVTMAVPEELGGGGAGLVELVLMAESIGRSMAPVPLIEAAVAARVLARHGAGRETLDRIVGQGHLVGIALAPTVRGRHLVSGGPVASAVIVYDAGELVVLELASSPPVLANLGRLPLGAVSRADGRVIAVLAGGEEAASSFGRARREWQVATAGALIAMADECLSVAVAHAKQRHQFGAPIGSFQAVAHPLADVSIAVQAGRRLVRKAAWYAEHEDTWWWTIAAFVHASSTAVKAAQTAAHTLGGVGVTESVATEYLRRAKAWALLAGDPEAELVGFADELLGAKGATR